MPAEAPRRHGRRLRALGDAFHRTVKYALRPVDHEAFAELFPGLREALVASLYAAFKQVRPARRPPSPLGCDRLRPASLGFAGLLRACCTAPLFGQTSAAAIPYWRSANSLCRRAAAARSSAAVTHTTHSTPHPKPRLPPLPLRCRCCTRCACLQRPSTRRQQRSTACGTSWRRWRSCARRRCACPAWLVCCLHGATGRRCGGSLQQVAAGLQSRAGPPTMPQPTQHSPLALSARRAWQTATAARRQQTAALAGWWHRQRVSSRVLLLKWPTGVCGSMDPEANNTNLPCCFAPPLQATRAGPHQRHPAGPAAGQAGAAACMPATSMHVCLAGQTPAGRDSFQLAKPKHQSCPVACAGGGGAAAARAGRGARGKRAAGGAAGGAAACGTGPASQVAGGLEEMGGQDCRAGAQRATRASAAALLLLRVARFGRPCVWLLPCPRSLPSLVPIPYPMLPPAPPPCILACSHWRPSWRRSMCPARRGPTAWWRRWGEAAALPPMATLVTTTDWALLGPLNGGGPPAFFL